MKHIKLLTTFLLFLIPGVFFGQGLSYSGITDSLHKIGQSEKIIPYLEKELSVKPKNEELLRLLGFYHIEGANLNVAEQYYREALANNPKCGRCYVNIAKIYAMRKDDKKALEYSNLAVLTAPDDGLIYFRRAKLKEHLGDKTGALVDFDKAISIEPQQGEYYLQRGLYHSDQGTLPLALSDFNKVIQLLPDYLNSYLYRATILYKMEQLDAACLDYQTAKRLVAQQHIKDNILISQIDAAIQDVCEVSKPSYFYQRGIANYNLKQYQAAIEQYEQGLLKFPANAMILNFQANAYLALAEYDQALVCYEGALKNKENLLEGLRSNPSFIASGSPQGTTSNEVNQTYKGMIAGIYYGIAECKIYLGNFDAALIAINKAIEFAPDFSDFPKERYFNMRGHIYLAMQQYEMSIADFNRSLEINKNFPLAYINRAIAKTNGVEQVKRSSYSVKGRLGIQPVSINWSMPSKLISKTALMSALADCNTALEIDENLGFGYYIRGQIKQLLNDKNYCKDLVVAKKLNVYVEDALLENCN